MEHTHNVIVINVSYILQPLKFASFMTKTSFLNFDSIEPDSKNDWTDDIKELEVDLIRTLVKDWPPWAFIQDFILT